MFDMLFGRHVNATNLFILTLFLSIAVIRQVNLLWTGWQSYRQSQWYSGWY